MLARSSFIVNTSGNPLRTSRLKSPIKRSSRNFRSNRGRSNVELGTCIGSRQ